MKLTERIENFLDDCENMTDPASIRAELTSKFHAAFRRTFRLNNIDFMTRLLALYEKFRVPVYDSEGNCHFSATPLLEDAINMLYEHYIPTNRAEKQLIENTSFPVFFLNQGLIENTNRKQMLRCILATYRKYHYRLPEAMQSFADESSPSPLFRVKGSPLIEQIWNELEPRNSSDSLHAAPERTLFFAQRSEPSPIERLLSQGQFSECDLLKEVINTGTYKQGNYEECTKILQAKVHMMASALYTIFEISALNPYGMLCRNAMGYDFNLLMEWLKSGLDERIQKIEHAYGNYHDIMKKLTKYPNGYEANENVYTIVLSKIIELALRACIGLVPDKRLTQYKFANRIISSAFIEARKSPETRVVLENILKNENHGLFRLFFQNPCAPLGQKDYEAWGPLNEILRMYEFLDGAPNDSAHQISPLLDEAVSELYRRYVPRKQEERDFINSLGIQEQAQERIIMLEEDTKNRDSLRSICTSFLKRNCIAPPKAMQINVSTTSNSITQRGNSYHISIPLLAIWREAEEEAQRFRDHQAKIRAQNQPQHQVRNNIL